LTEADIPEACQGRVTLSTQDPRALMASLSAQGWSKAYIDGGAVIRSFIKDGLISEITITQLPILIGQGRRLFGSLQQDMTLDCLAVNHFPSGLVQVRYHLT
jgi:riboflavin biosynthesis pyrimidine reductase